MPYDAERGVIVNEAGRVTRGVGEPIPGLYANGWIKRGPVGLIGATKSDAVETISSLLTDLEEGGITPAPDRDNDSILRLLDAKGVAYTTWEGWVALDEHEIERGASETDADGEPRPRIKVVEREEMVRISREGMERAAAEQEQEQEQATIA